MAKNRRKTESVDDDADLCVFGFEVKLFNQAESIDKEGPYMIHLPCDDDVEVDRYDCRLLLHSSKEMGELQPKSDVPDFEEDYLCEEERYLDLKNLEVKDKPSPQINNTGVPFTYEKQSPSPPAVNSVIEEPFVPPKHQIYPSGMILPSTKKQALLIEKTAKFVVEKGADYETSISSKASSNKNLCFLLPGDPLNGYYKYVVSLMKDKIYILIPEHQEEENASESDEEYLSPLLMRKRKQHPEPSAAPKPKKAGNFSVFYKSNENDVIIQPKLYLNGMNDFIMVHHHIIQIFFQKLLNRLNKWLLEFEIKLNKLRKMDGNKKKFLQILMLLVQNICNLQILIICFISNIFLRELLKLKKQLKNKKGKKQHKKKVKS
jgi:hypothetical protein